MHPARLEVRSSRQCSSSPAVEPEGADGSRLRFRASAGPGEGRLAPLAVGAALDRRALVPWILWDVPNHVSETPYASIRVEVLEERSDVIAAGVGPASVEDASNALRIAIRDAVARAMGTARRVAVLTGGGLDSSGILAMAVNVARERGGSAFAVALDYAADGDDRPHLRALEAQLGCEVLRVVPESASQRRALLDGVDGAPLNIPTAPMEIELMARARANGAEVILTGAGGDELFDGDPRSLSGWMRAGRVREAVRAARALRGFEWERRSLAGWLLRPLVAPYVPARIRMMNARRSKPYAPDWAGPALVAARAEARERSLEALAARLSQKMEPERTPTELYRVYLAWYRHQGECVSGITRRDPYVDRSLVRFVHRLPPQWLLRGDMRRGLFREAMRGVLPESLRLREDKAHGEPALLRWVESVGGIESFRPLATMDRLATLGLVDAAKFSAIFDAYVRAPRMNDFWATEWPALMVESFLRARERG